ncbi:MAG: universal stress protein [Bernardetiaceae bacterium]
MKRLLIPINFSEASKEALPMAFHIAHTTGAALTFLTSGASPLTEDNLSEYLRRPLPQDPQARQAALLQALQDLTKPYEEKTSIAVAHQIRHGLFMRDIVDQVQEALEKEQPYDLIVMGTHGVQIPAESIWGTYTANLIHEIETPMLIVPVGAGHKLPKHLIFAATLEDNDALSLQYLKQYTDIFPADLTCLHITTTANDEADAKERLLNLEANYVFTPVHAVKFELMHDDRVSHGLQAYLQSHDPALLAIRPKHRNFIESLFRASLSRQLALHSQHPILIIRDPHQKL